MQDSEHFLHRSGRTGRAGKSGTTIVMFTKPEGRDIQRVMKETHTKIDMIGPPAPREVMQASTKSVLSRMSSVQPEVVKFFSPAAEKLISAGNGEQVGQLLPGTESAERLVLGLCRMFCDVHCMLEPDLDLQHHQQNDCQFLWLFV